MEIIICKVLKGDLEALEDLTYERREEFLRKHHLPRELPVVLLRIATAASAAVLATMSRVAHAKLPLVGELAKLPVCNAAQCSNGSTRPAAADTVWGEERWAGHVL